MRIYLTILIAMALLIGITILQIFLSKKESKWPGLILPLICFIISIAIFDVKVSDSSIISVLLSLIASFMLYSIGTAILLIMYFVCRENNKKSKEKELIKMNIQDLE